MITFDFTGDVDRNSLLRALQALKHTQLLESIPLEDHLKITVFKGTPQEKVLSRLELKRLLYRRSGCGC